MKNETLTTIESVRTTYPRISLKRICDELNLCYQYVLKVSKQPIPGKPYDPTEINYPAIEKIVTNKKVNISEIDWEEIESSIKIIEPINKPEDFTVGTQFTLRGNDNVWEVVYRTVSHVVFIADNDTQPRVMNWDTFEHQSPRIVRS